MRFRGTDVGVSSSMSCTCWCELINAMQCNAMHADASEATSFEVNSVFSGSALFAAERREEGFITTAARAAVAFRCSAERAWRGAAGSDLRPRGKNQSNNVTDGTQIMYGFGFAMGFAVHPVSCLDKYGTLSVSRSMYGTEGVLENLSR